MNHSSGHFCNPGEENLAPQERCVACFCMGRSQKCHSGNLYRDRVGPLLVQEQMYGVISKISLHHHHNVYVEMFPPSQP